MFRREIFYPLAILVFMITVFCRDEYLVSLVLKSFSHQGFAASPAVSISCIDKSNPVINSRIERFQRNTVIDFAPSDLLGTDRSRTSHLPSAKSYFRNPNTSVSKFTIFHLFFLQRI